MPGHWLCEARPQAACFIRHAKRSGVTRSFNNHVFLSPCPFVVCDFSPVIARTPSPGLEQGVEALINFVREPWNVRKVDIAMYIDSPLSDSLCFALPLLSYNDGKWKSVIEMVRGFATASTSTQLPLC